MENSTNKKVISDIKNLCKQIKELREKQPLIIEKSLEKYVNGKIDKLTQKLDDYILSDNKWKESAEPVLQLGRNAEGTSKTIFWLSAIIIAIGGAFAIIKGLFK